MSGILKSEHYDGVDDTAAECETRLDIFLAIYFFVCYNIIVRKEFEMLYSYLALQNAYSMNNFNSLNMVYNSDKLLNSINTNNSQPLKPSFASKLNAIELSLKTSETKASVTQKLIEAYHKKLGKDIEKSVPKYSGLNVKA